MKLPAVTLVAMLGLSASAFAQSSAIWQPCLAGEASMEGVIGAFQSDGWAFPTSNDEHVGNLQAVAEPLFAVQNIPDVGSGSGFDRHITVAHERAEAMLIDAATLQRDGLIVAIESGGNGGPIRCTIAGSEFDEVAYAFDGGGDDVRNVNGHEIIEVALPQAATQQEVTLYRLLPPTDASVEAKAPFAAIVVRHLQ